MLTELAGARLMNMALKESNNNFCFKRESVIKVRWSHPVQLDTPHRDYGIGTIGFECYVPWDLTSTSTNEESGPDGGRREAAAVLERSELVHCNQKVKHHGISRNQLCRP